MDVLMHPITKTWNRSEQPWLSSDQGIITASSPVGQGFVAYLEFLRDVDAPMEPETEAYIDNFVMGRDQVSA